jgi:hypothetical protein
MFHRTFLLAIALAAPCSQIACSDRRHVPVSSSTASAYDRWRMRSSDAFRAEEWREFDAMLQELRLRIMANREATGHDGIESALRSKIDGASFREVLVMGCQAKLARLTAEREPMRRVLNANAHRTGILSNTGPFAEFERARAEQEKKLLAIDDQIRAAERRLADFGRYR